MPLTENSKQIPVRLTGSSVFGRYPTISSERTYNMFVSSSGDGEQEWLINFSGYDFVKRFYSTVKEGRGIFRSVRGGFILCVVDNGVFIIYNTFSAPSLVGNLISNSGEVYIDENLNAQIGIVDGSNLYIYNHNTTAFAIATITPSISSTELQPNYICYHNTYFIIGNGLETLDNYGSNFYLLGSGSGTSLDNLTFLAIQTKPDYAKAAIRIPGSSNNVIFFGKTVAEVWTDVGGLQYYQRNSSININYGTVSVATIASDENIIAWLSINEKSSPAIMSFQGGTARRISTDGIDHLLDSVIHPEDSTALFYRQDGHLFYILSFFNSADNFSILYDFTTNKIYDATDWDFGAFPARQIVYFDNETYFINFKNGNLYAINNSIDHYNVDGTERYTYTIPRWRITNNFRFDAPEKFKIKVFTFVIESGTTPSSPSETLPRVDIAISKNGGLSWSNFVPYTMKPTGDFVNQPRFNNLGSGQQIAFKFNFINTGRLVMKNGIVEIGP